MIYLDLETMASGGPDKDSPEAHWSSNRVLLCGWAIDHDEVQVDPDTSLLAAAIQARIDNSGECELCAHNAKFDLKYLMREHPTLKWDCVRVWDTMTWEYLNSGHRITMASLEDTATRYNIKFSKSLDLGALLSSGIKMENIPTDELEDYLIEDVRVLRDIHSNQRRVATYWMDYILPLAEMELNGLTLDIHKAEQLARELQMDIDESYEYIRDYIKDNCEWQDGSAITLDDFSDLVYPKSKFIKPTANRTISFLLAGAPEELKITPKWRVHLKGVPLLSSIQRDNIYEDIEPTHIGYPVDEETIERINMELGNNVEMLEHLIRHRKATKIVHTYLLPMIRQARVEGTVHPKLNTAITATGRLSSSNPNGQNMPPEVRELIIPSTCVRELEEVDFSQLEMVGAATLSKDTQLIYDLRHGVDIHANTATKVFGAEQAEEKRKLAKNVNFGVLYGGKAYGLSKQTGVDKATIQDLIDAFYSTYPGVSKWQRSLFENVVDSMEAHDVKDGEQRYHSDYVLPVSQRKFRFIETEAPNWIRRKTHRKFSFSPNHTANYPIQGFAGGDIVMYGLWYLWKSIRNILPMRTAQFRLTVHDSILLERPQDWDFNHYYDSMCDAIGKRFNLPVKLHVDVEAGLTWR